MIITSVFRTFFRVPLLLFVGLLPVVVGDLRAADGNGVPAAPALTFQAANATEAAAWRTMARQRLCEMMMGGRRPDPAPVRPQLLRQIEVTNAGYRLEELTLQSLPDRTVHAWLALPRGHSNRVGAVLALPGHGGSGADVIQGKGIYWYGRALVELGYVVIAPDISQHELQHTNWSLMGERVWDALSCVDYLVTRPEVDANRLAVAGLSLGGETAMYVGALDERVRAVVSSGWLSTVANLKNGHCPCWNFPGLEAAFDFSDIFACIAPRPLLCELGEQERAPGGFPVAIGQEAFRAITRAYTVEDAGAAARLVVHPDGHVFDGTEVWPWLQHQLGGAWPYAAGAGHDAAELLRRGELARRSLGRAFEVLENQGRTRDAVTGLMPLRPAEPIWRPAVNGAVLLPAMALSSREVAPLRLENWTGVVGIERRVIGRWQGLPDDFSLASRSWVESQPDPRRSMNYAATYAAEGVLPVVEQVGRGIWFDRLRELAETVEGQALVTSDFGPLPSDELATLGRWIEVGARLYELTGEERHLDFTVRLAQACTREVMARSGGLLPARWDFATHQAAGRGEVEEGAAPLLRGLGEAMRVARAARPEVARGLHPAVASLAERVRPGATAGDPPGRLRAALTLAAGLGEDEARSWARAALRHASEATVASRRAAGRSPAAALDDTVAAFALAGERSDEGLVERLLPNFFGRVRERVDADASIVEAREVRSALAVGRFWTQGFRAEPWNPELRFGAVNEGGSTWLAVVSPASWTGRLIADQSRRVTSVKTASKAIESAGVEEWFTAVPGRVYAVSVDGGPAENWTGSRLRDGLFLELKVGVPVRIQITETRL